MSRPIRSKRAGLSIPAAVLALAVLACIPALVAQTQEPLDYDAIVKIKDEGFQRSQVMDLTSYLTDIYGPRLTGSPNYEAAANWARKRFAEWGVANPHFEPFEFGRGWSNERLVARVVAPQSYPLIAYAKAWTAGTDGPVRADVVKGVVEDDQDMEKLKGKLKGKIVLSLPMPG
jgi:hypothetical protein